ncbi:ClpP/crotonase [Gonapodya prolifera JEL478]|uniref:ClpP/crotonase n=1 Tax=Gonapodya prolifera (strain JEL478) TaxID=1344416 RepID=A0A139ADN7_GONPJ|nr:ClpP/crotonase [Gonapodya prolifera JEL478]|eukprot:KXS14704.1 ClpP/crotonase [Gonapodya prolifera JEL478]
MAAPTPRVDNFTQIAYSVTPDGIAIVSLNRPKYRNPIGRTCTLELDAAFTAACNDDAVKVIILRGEGDSFSSGHDLGTPDEKKDATVSKLQADGFRGDYERWSYLDVDMCLKWWNMRKPLICAVKGYVVYHAFAVMAIADIIIAADDVKLMPSLVEFTSLPWDLNLNIRKTKELLYSQRFILADEAEELGIVNRIVPRGKEDEEALGLARIIVKTDPFQLRMMKLAANQAADSAGYSVNIRSSLSHWTAYRASSTDPASNAVATGSKRFAPIKESEKEDVMYWSRTAPKARKGERGKL